MRWFVIVFILLMATLTLVNAQDGEKIFYSKCAGCHSIGGGDRAGPDLMGVTEKRDVEWLIRVIVEPDKLTAEEDPVQMELIAKYGLQMPNLGVTRDEAIEIIKYLNQFSTSPSEIGRPKEPQLEEQQEQKIPVAPGNYDVKLGRALFTGESRFKNGGAPCISCHSVKKAGIDGGTLAVDLSDLYPKLGEKGLYGIFKSLQFPVMKDIYAGKPLTDKEIYGLIAFFQEASASPKKSAGAYPLSGIGLFLIGLLVAVLYYRRLINGR
jgi:mono/diheme cytochrome c family protein